MEKITIKSTSKIEEEIKNTPYGILNNNEFYLILETHKNGFLEDFQHSKDSVYEFLKESATEKGSLKLVQTFLNFLNEDLKPMLLKQIQEIRKEQIGKCPLENKSVEQKLVTLIYNNYDDMETDDDIENEILYRFTVPSEWFKKKYQLADSEIDDYVDELSYFQAGEVNTLAESDGVVLTWEEIVDSNDK